MMHEERDHASSMGVPAVLTGENAKHVDAVGRDVQLSGMTAKYQDERLEERVDTCPSTLAKAYSSLEH